MSAKPRPSNPAVCEVVGCEKETQTGYRGMCSMHNARLRRRGSVDAARPMRADARRWHGGSTSREFTSDEIAEVARLYESGMTLREVAEYLGENKKAVKAMHGLAGLALRRTRKGFTRDGVFVSEPRQRFFPRLVFGETTYNGTRCLEWTGASDPHGYGKFGLAGKVVLTHRWLYERWSGPVPDGLVLDHLCRNPPCCNPVHLEPVTIAENARRGTNGALKTHCVHGHPRTAENIYKTAKGHVRCRPCRRAKNAAKRASERAA